MKYHKHMLLLCLTALALAAPFQITKHDVHAADVKFGPQAIWTLPRQTLFECLEKARPGASCLTQIMKKTGASQEALAINALLDGEGYMTAFQPMGRINMATVEFPMRANTNQAYVLVGGIPSLVSSELSVEAVNIQADPAYPELKRRFPDIAFWPTSAEFRTMEQLRYGGQSFVFAYPLLNGCHACELAGYALIALDFAPDGTYKGPRLIKLEPAKELKTEAHPS